jgi:hypothetical protein
MRRLFIIIFLLLPFFHSQAGEHVVLYRIGEKDPVAWNLLSKYFTSKGYNVSTYEGTDSLEKHIENVNRINKGKGSLLLAIDFNIGETNHVLIAITDAKKGKGNVLAIEEVPAIHESNSKELATLLASSFNRGVKQLPLFPLLGVDMPGIFLRMECTKEKAGEMLNKLHDSLQKYFRRGIKK